MNTSLHILRGFALAVVLLEFVRPLSAADWPQWRGPDRSNRSSETGLLDAWPVGAPPLLWKATGLGEGIASVAVANGVVYTVGYSQGREFVYALGATTGELHWAANVGPAVGENPRMRWLSQRTPTVDEERLYTVTAGGELFCLAVRDGRKLWHRSYSNEFSAPRPRWGFSDRPLVDGEMLICVPAGASASVAALNKRSGEVLWKTVLPGNPSEGYAATVLSQAVGVRQYLVFLKDGLYGVGADGGRVLWRYTNSVGRYSNSYTPLVHGDLVFSANGYGGGMGLLQISRDGNLIRTDQQYHRRFEFNPFQDSTVLVGDHVYSLQHVGKPICIDLRTGKLAWGPVDTQVQDQASLTYADGHLYVRRSSGLVVLQRATPSAYVESGSFRIDDPEDATGATAPVISGGRLYLRDNRRLLCYDISTNSLSKPIQPARTVEISVVGTPGGGAVAGGEQRHPDAVFVPTPHDVVTQMLSVAEVGSDDVVWDLGSGDGRILLTAARIHGSRAIGYEIDPELVQHSRERICIAGLIDRVAIHQADLFTADLSSADVVALYLPPESLERLVPQLKTLKPGARIVSHQFLIPGFPPDHTLTTISTEDGEPHRIHVWRAPLKKTTGDSAAEGLQKRPTAAAATAPPGVSLNDWPAYGGGPTRNAVRMATDPPRRWGIQTVERGLKPGFNVKWMAQTGGSFSMAQPIIADGFVWVGTNNQNPRDPDHREPAGVLMCFRESDGAFVWQYLAPVRNGMRRDLDFTGLKCSPWIEGDRLWFTTPGAEVVCLDIGSLRRGEGAPRELWKVDLTKRLGVHQHSFVMGWPGANSVAVHNRWVYVNTDNGVDYTHVNIPAPDAPSLVCFEKETGQLVWKDNSPGTNIFHMQWSSPLAFSQEGEARVIAGMGDGWLRCFAADSGQRLWEVDCNPPEYRKVRYLRVDGPSEILATPVLHEGRIYVTIGQDPEHGEGRGNLVCVDAKTGEVIWQNQTLQRSLSSPIVGGATVYAADFSGFVYGLAADTGRVLWRFNAQSHVWSTPLLVNRVLYVPDEDGDLSVLDLDQVEAQALAHQGVLQLDKRSFTNATPTGVEPPVVAVNFMQTGLFSSPAFANGVLFVHADGYLSAIASASPATHPTVEPGSRRRRDAVYVPTPQDVVERMLKLAAVSERDLVVDLGSGDGRIVMTAARDRGSRAIGYEVDPTLVRQSRQSVRDHKLEHRVRIEERDLFEADLEDVDVVMTFLPESVLQRLAPAFARLKPGARVVSHDFVIPGAAPDQTIRMISQEDGAEHAIHLWKAPLAAKP